MATTTIWFCAILLAVYAALRMSRVMRESSKRRADERLKAHINWENHPRKPAV